MTASQEKGLAPTPESFEIPEDVTYLNCANMSPQLKAVRTAGIEAVRARALPWELVPERWFSGAEKLRALASRLLDATADSVALVPSVSYAIAIAAANVPIRPGQSVVLLDQQFPSNVYAWRRLATASGGEVRFVRRPRNGEWTDALLDSIDENTAVVSVPNCHWTDGGLVDLRRVGERTRAVEAAFVVDASQSLGAYPLSVKEVRPDFLVSVGYKWLLGPYGLGYLYVGPRFRESGKPLEESWLSRSGSSDFSRLVDYTDTYRPGARRFDMGEFPQFGSMPQAIAAFEQILDWGVDRIQASLSLMTRRVSEGAASFGGSTLDELQRGGHLVGIRMPGGLPEGLARTLSDERVYVSVRGDCIRVAPHLHNTSSDIDRLLDLIGEEAVKSRTPHPPGRPRQSR